MFSVIKERFSYRHPGSAENKVSDSVWEGPASHDQVTYRQRNQEVVAEGTQTAIAKEGQQHLKII